MWTRFSKYLPGKRDRSWSSRLWRVGPARPELQDVLSRLVGRRPSSRGIAWSAPMVARAMPRRSCNACVARAPGPELAKRSRIGRSARELASSATTRHGMSFPAATLERFVGTQSKWKRSPVKLRLWRGDSLPSGRERNAKSPCPQNVMCHPSRNLVRCRSGSSESIGERCAESLVTTACAGSRRFSLQPSAPAS